MMELVTARRVVEAAYGKLHPRKKGRWVQLTKSEIQRNPELAKELHDLVSTAYAPIGGHVNFRTPADIGKEATFWVAADIDGDAEPDVVSMGKHKPAGIKSVGMGHDGTAAAKRFVLDKKAKSLRQRGHYGELSGAIAHIMLTRHNAPTVNTKAGVERVLGKKIEWVGEHPSGKYPNNPGWYKRKIAGKYHTKILVGMPNLREAREIVGSLVEVVLVDAPAEVRERLVRFLASASKGTWWTRLSPSATDPNWGSQVIHVTYRPRGSQGNWPTIFAVHPAATRGSVPLRIGAGRAEVERIADKLLSR